MNLPFHTALTVFVFLSKPMVHCALTSLLLSDVSMSLKLETV